VKDFGPNCATGGCQFFKSLFKELLNKGGAADLKCDDLTDIKNHKFVYNDSIVHVVLLAIL